ncbi:MAG: hypothetical protein QOD99_2566 [Chthoniobacter sp.]|nr:hypothetical protein [Chthoniobacter sp.]
MKTHFSLKTTLCLILLATATLSTARAATTGGIDTRTAFARMKSLSGDWTGPKMMGHPMNMNVRVIAGGSAVLATFCAGTPMEMITVYYVSNDKLVQTHYCMLGNQPRMKLNAKKSSADTLVFDFAGGDNIKATRMNMHGETLHFVGRKKIESTCMSEEKGKPHTTHTTVMVRR